MIRNQVQLITYPDSLGGTISDVHNFINTYLSDVVGGVHILPFYPSSADRGFAPLTHLEVDEVFGTWEDIRKISADYDLVVDLTVNHISCESEYFRDYLEKGEDSLYASMFLNIDTFLSRHKVDVDALATTYRPRPTLPFTVFNFGDGTTKKIWTTFTNHQIDLDVMSEMTRTIMVSFINQLVRSGAKIIRLDAVGYTIKKPWTNSFLIPETYDFIKWLRNVTPNSVNLLAEVHHSPVKQQELLKTNSVEWVYDFSLPLLVLHAIYSGKVQNIYNWVAVRPTHIINTLDTHDGIGVVDVEDLMSESEVAETVAWVEQHGGNEAYRASGTYAENLDIYQLNSTYYSALGEDDDAYITARAIQFFIPGIPQVYYVGLLAGVNDYEQMIRTKHGRDVNRHNFTLSEIEKDMNKPVVQRLLNLMRLRSNHPAFQGTFTQSSISPEILIFRWEKGGLYCQSEINVRQKTVEVELIDPVTRKTEKIKY